MYRLNLLAVIAMTVGLCATARADFDEKVVPAPTAIPVRPKAEIPAKESTKKQGNKKEADKKSDTKKGAKSNAKESPKSAQPSGSGGLMSGDVFKHDSDAPLNYKAEMGGGSRKDGAIELIKNVVIQQEELTLKADKADLYSTPNSTTPTRVLAKGNVQLEKKGLTEEAAIHALADEIEYFADTRKAVLRGKPKIWKGKEMLRGEVIELDMVTEDIRVKNPSGVVDPKSAKNESGSKGDSKNGTQ